MKSFLSFIALVVSLAVTASAFEHGGHGLSARHHAIAESSLVARQGKRVRKRCRNPGNGVVVNNSANNGTSNANPAGNTNSLVSNTNNHNNNGGGGGGGGNPGVLYMDGPCGPSRAQEHASALAGRNGHIDWLNCGVEAGGWNPPRITIDQLKTISLEEALAMPGTVFENCRPFVPIFDQAGSTFGVPPIVLASFAMQESSCRPETVGGGGEQGLMQITHDKCGDAPGGNCREPWYNIFTAARYFSQTLANNGGNFLQTLGQYNGWPLGMTIGSATAARWGPCCRCQNNLDYLHQFCNGWLQGVNSYGNPRLGKYFNLDVCP